MNARAIQPFNGRDAMGTPRLRRQARAGEVLAAAAGQGHGLGDAPFGRRQLGSAFLAHEVAHGRVAFGQTQRDAPRGELGSDAPSEARGDGSDHVARARLRIECVQREL